MTSIIIKSKVSIFAMRSLNFNLVSSHKLCENDISGWICIKNNLSSIADRKGNWILNLWQCIANQDSNNVSKIITRGRAISSDIM